MTKRPLLSILSLGLALFVSASVTAAQKNSETGALTGGSFEMKATYKFSDQDQPIVNFGGTVAVQVKGKEISVKVPIFDQPIAMKLSNGVYTGVLNDAGANIQFRCEIAGKDHTEGIFFGTLGQRKVTGIWTMKRAKTQASDKSTT